MTTREALAQIDPLLENHPAVCATGYIAREVQSIRHRNENFYVIGSMGMCSSIGLGLALSLPEKKVFVLDGDGSVLMNMGNLALVGALKPKNFYHIVFDNEAYASTGNQKTISGSVALEEVARASGYRVAQKAEPDEVRNLIAQEGPVFCLIKVGPDTAKPAPRIQPEPHEITREFMKAVS